MIRRTSLALVAIAALGAVSLAAAAEVDRATYKAQVEPICKTNSQANERILKTVRRDVKAGKLKKAARSFAQAGAALKQTYTQLKAVPQPSADEAKLGKWLGYVKVEYELFLKVSKKLKAGNKHAAQSLVNKLTSNANLANATVLAFEFHYCRFEPSKYT